MSENTRMILAGIGGGVLVLASVLGLNEANVETPVTPKPTAEAPAPQSPCPDGWEDTSTTDEHTVVLSCERNGWLVILKPDGTFERALQLNTPGAQFIESPAEVPGWSD